MHNAFRTFGQAMGLQLVRGILPESIDVYLNAAIIEKCRSILLEILLKLEYFLKVLQLVQ